MGKEDNGFLLFYQASAYSHSFWRIPNLAPQLTFLAQQQLELRCLLLTSIKSSSHGSIRKLAIESNDNLHSAVMRKFQ